MTDIQIICTHLRGLDPVRDVDAITNLERVLARVQAHEVQQAARAAVYIHRDCHAEISVQL